MLLSLVDVFRCPADHDETALVLSVDTWNGARIHRGTLGCPTCHSRYPIEDAVVDFRSAGADQELPNSAPRRPLPDESIRLLAQLDLMEPGGVVLLTGSYGAMAGALLSGIEFTCLVVDAPATHESSVALLLDRKFPFAAGSIRAVAVDQSRATPEFLGEAARVLRPGGRLVAPADASLPEHVNVIARDNLEWVGVVEPAPNVVQLSRGPR